jgi:hypothetical protein
MKRSIALLALFVACGAPPAAEAPPAPEEAPPAVVPATEEDASVPEVEASVADASLEAAATAPVAVASDAGKEAAADVPERPLVIQGARRCTDEENADEVCFVNKKGALCRDGQCITSALCPKYCAALGARSHEGCMEEPDKDCKKIPECASVYRKLRADCKKMIAQFTQDCVSLTCSLIKTLPEQQAP